MCRNERGTDPGAPGPAEIRAAGGLLERHTPRGVEIALVHRTRHGSEWSLPKGKLRPGESWEAGALREVREETGCEARIAGYAGTVRYEVDGIPKTVRFWRMLLRAERAFQASEEVRELAWMTPRDALDTLDHAEQRQLVADVYLQGRRG